jgi:soluble lytic murein transglycosylase-like protein
MRRWAKFGIALLLAAMPAFAAELAVLQNGATIHCMHREVIGEMTRLYATAGNEEYVDVPTSQIDHFEADLTPDPVSAANPNKLGTINVNDLISDAGGKHFIDPDLLASVIHAESNFKVHAVSPKGAQGLMQLMPDTASQLGVANAFDPSANVEGGTRYLRELLEKYNFDLVKALAAYNAGPLRVDRYHGVPPYYETQAYVARIVREYNKKKLAEQKAAKAATQSASAGEQQGSH